MKLKTIIICFLCGVFLIGVGSALTFFEVAGFEVRDGIPPYAEPELELENYTAGFAIHPDQQYLYLYTNISPDRIHVEEDEDLDDSQISVQASILQEHTDLSFSTAAWPEGWYVQESDGSVILYDGSDRIVRAEENADLDDVHDEWFPQEYLQEIYLFSHPYSNPDDLRGLIHSLREKVFYTYEHNDYDTITIRVPEGRADLVQVISR